MSKIGCVIAYGGINFGTLLQDYATVTKIQELGYGGFAKVYRVQNILTKEVFACKELIKAHI